HFQQLQKDFEYYGITLDSTKGLHPNDKRFYSFDPDAVINNSFDVYDRLVKRKSKPQRPPVNHSTISHSDKYAETALNNELETLARTSNGNRNNQLFKSAASLAQLVAGGVLSENEVSAALHDTGLALGLPEWEVKRTINSGFDAGLKTPRKPAKSKRSKPLRTKEHTSNGKYKTKEFKNKTDKPKKNKDIEKGYPTALDAVEPPEKGSIEDYEAIRHTINDADKNELEELCDRDPMVAKMVQ